MGSRHLILGNTEIFRLTDEHLKAAGLANERLVSGWEGKCVAKVEVEAAGLREANAVGRPLVTNALDVLRVSARNHLIGRQSDNLFLWEAGNSVAVDADGTTVGWHNNREVFPFAADIGDSAEELLNDPQSVWSLLARAQLPEDIHNRLTRAIEWISLAITEHILDHKLMHVCTALEVMLLPDHTLGKKGELIALRQVLVGENMFKEPTGILALYEQRGNVVHGGRLRIVTYNGYWHMLDCSLSVLTKLVRLSQRFPAVDTLRGLLHRVENEETLRDFTDSCEKGLYRGRGINEIKKVAQRRLSALTS